MPTTMAKPKKNEKDETEDGLPWAINLKIDPALKPLVEQYRDSKKREFKPSLTQFVEKAFKMLLESDGLWPPKEEEN
jgi:hypothetical protein